MQVTSAYVPNAKQPLFTCLMQSNLSLYVPNKKQPLVTTLGGNVISVDVSV